MFVQGGVQACLSFTIYQLVMDLPWVGCEWENVLAVVTHRWGLQTSIQVYVGTHD